MESSSAGAGVRAKCARILIVPASRLISTSVTYAFSRPPQLDAWLAVPGNISRNDVCSLNLNVLFDKVNKCIAQAIIWVGPQNLSVLKQQSAVLAAGYAVVGFPSLARAVDNAAHNGNGYVPVDAGYALFDLVCKGY